MLNIEIVIGFYVVVLFKAVDRWEIVGLAMVAIVFGAAAGVVLMFGGALIIGVAGLLGIGLGLAAVVPCWRQGDRAGRAMAILGCAPLLLVVLNAVR